MALGLAARRLPPSPAPPHPRHRRGRPGDAAARRCTTSLGAHQISAHDAKVAGHLAARAVGRGGPGGRGGQRAAHPRPRARGVPLAVRGTEDPRPHPTHAAEEQASSELRDERPCATSPSFQPCGPPSGARRAASSGTPAPTTWRARGHAEALRRAEVEPGDDRGPRARLRAPRGRAGPERRPPGRLPGRPARRGPGDDHQPLLLVGPAGGGHRRRSHRGRRHRRGARGRPRVDVDGPDGRRQDRRSTRRVVEQFPDAYIPMGNTAENVARQFGVSRGDQDAFALREPPEGGRGAGRAATSRPRSCP